MLEKGIPRQKFPCGAERAFRLCPAASFQPDIHVSHGQFSALGIVVLGIGVGFSAMGQPFTIMVRADISRLLVLYGHADL